uniref:PH domain-containing protein n=1 Tax=Globisporangium ultimum (strain ATCC 200006 / CBS 805.95 / DAOM BR144) TaxID=431595 RepID=K3WTL4_GLOUD
MGEEPVKPIPFVLVADDGSFSVNPEACERIEKIKGKLVVIAVAGLYRTGKSFLLNLLVRHVHNIDNAGVAADAMDAMENAGFAVGGTVNACTKGIWMWGEPIVMKDGTSYLFLDTEGLGSVDREQTHDTRIFALALLLATNFIYNSRGVIDGNAIEDLSLVVNLSKHIQTSSSQKESGGADLYEFFPSFMWVVRDFTLQLLDNGKKISSKQYLENALKPQGGYSDDAVAKDQIRVLLSDFFRQRDCVTLVRPVDDEQKLRTLPKVPYEELRDDRVVQAQCDDALADSIELYKKEITSRIRVYTSPEQYEKDADFEDEEKNRNTLSPIDYGQGDNVMFDEFGNLRNVQMKAANPQTDEEGQESEMIEVMEEDDVEEQVKIERTRLPCAEDTLMHVHKLCKRIAKKRLREVVDSDISDDASQYLDQFRVAINSIFDTFKQQNAAASMAYCRHVLEKLSRPGKEYLEDIEGNNHKSAMELHRETQEYLQGALETVYDEYFSRAIGPSADAAYCEFVTQTVVGQVIQRTEHSNVAHMTEVRALEKEMNDMSVKVAIAQGQAGAMQELSLQQRQKCELTVKEAEQRCANEISALRATLEFKTNELEHVLNHNATLKRLADTAQQGQYRATEFATSAFATVLAGYLIKQQVMPGQVPSKAKWQQRYFVLQGNQLSFYDTKDDYERCRSDNPPMDVTGAIIEDSYVIPEAFSISFAENKYFPLHLHAKSLETKKEWVDSLRRASVSSRVSSYGTLSMSSSRYMQM